MLKKWGYNALFVLGIFAMLIIANLSILIPLVAPIPLSYTNLPFPTSKTEYNAKDTFVMKVEQCSSESLPVSVVSVKEIYSPITQSSTNLSSGARIIPPGCTAQDVMYSSVFPPSLEDGVYVMRGVTTFRGKLKTVDVSWQTQPFVYKRSEND